MRGIREIPKNGRQRNETSLKDILTCNSFLCNLEKSGG